MQQTGNMSYGDRPQMGLDVEFGVDPASGGFFNTDYRKHDDLKQMLDSNKDGLKLEAMKRIISMVARGRDASDLFPAVVKNVVSKNIEVKKLVYVYLMRYAEEQQDLVLLSISTFQRALKDPNQLIRASALRVLSSIRVLMIVPIVMLAIRDSASDMSPYVRKTAAHAIPKLHSLEPNQKDELIAVIDKLLSDRTTLVVGSAVMAFEEVCPERVDLIHKNFRKLCNLLVDVDEWGQVIIINMLTRYARSQFINPNPDDVNECEKFTKFYDDNEDSDQHHSDLNKKKKNNDLKHSPYAFDVDHRLLLRQTKPLLQSRNASVVMAVAQLYHHVAPRGEVNITAKSLIRLLRGHKEVQSIVLTCIASMTTKRKSIFEIHLKSFFVRTNDPTNIKLLKLEILTNLATVNSIAVILREFQTYINSIDRPFVAATIQAIGRCAASIKEVTETCLSGLVQLLSNKDEHVVAESVVVIKKLLQTKAAEHFEIISQMAKLLDFITVPAARASILWLIGEYNDKVPKIAPDVLRKMAKTFVDEEEIVKLQCLNLSLKLYLTNPEQTSLLCQYVFTLARYDSNYDVRDRSRFLRQFILPSNGKGTVLSKNARNIFFAPKPAPALESKYQGRDHFQLGSLSHYLNMRANGYNDLPDFPQVPSDPSLRNTEPFKTEQHEYNSASQKNNHSKKQRHESFSDSEKSSNYSNSDESSSSEEKSSDEEEEDVTHKKVNLALKIRKAADGNSDTDSSSDSSSSSESGQSSTSNGSSSESNSGNEDETDKVIVKTKEKSSKVPNSKAETKNDLDLLLDFNDTLPAGPVLIPSIGDFSTQGPVELNADNHIELVGPSFVDFEYKDLVSKLSGNGLSIRYRFTRSPHLFSSTMVSIEFVFMNHSEKEIKNIQIASHKNFPSGMGINDFDPIEILQPQQSSSRVFGVDWNDSTQNIEFEIQSSVGTFKICLKAPIGEIIRSVQIGENFFREQRQKLRGMNEHRNTVPSLNITDINSVKAAVFKQLNVASVPSSSSDTLNFAGQTITSKNLVLISLQLLQNEISVLVNCEKMVIGSMILNQVCTLLSRF